MITDLNFLRAKKICPYLPWCQDEVDKLGPAVTQFVFDQEAYMRRWAQRWFENFQFVYGNTSVRWSRRYDFAVDVDFLRRDVTMNSRAATNISRVVAEALASLMYSSLPTWAAEAMDESAIKGTRFAKIVEKLTDCYQQRLCCDREFATAALVFTVFGQYAARIDWDPKAGSIIDVPSLIKVKKPIFTDWMSPNQVTGGQLEIPTPALNSMGQPYSEDAWQYATDASGRQLTKRIAAGDVRLQILTPLEYRREIGSQGMHKTRYVEHIKLLDYDEFLDEYGELDGKTKYFDSITPMIHDATMYSFAVRHFMRMQFTTPPTVSEGQGFRRTESVLKSSLFKHKVLVVEHFDKPKRGRWDEGRRIVVANGQCTHVTKPQYRTNKKDGWHPFVEGQWMSIAPASVCSGPMDAVTAKNRELNVADSLIATSLRRNMGSMMLYKIGSGFDPGKMSGEPGQSMPLNDLDGVRWLHDSQPMPAVIKDLRQLDKDDIYEMSGAGDALRGERSPGTTSGYALQQLEEREQNRLAPAKKNFEASISGIGEKIIACLKQNVTKLEPDVLGFLTRSGAGEFQPDDIIAFLSTPIDYGVDIKVEAESMNVKSKATMQANLLELAKGPCANRLANDAYVLDEFLKYFGVTKLRDRSAPHRDRATRENEIFLDLIRMGPTADGIKLPVVVQEDDDMIHLDAHDDFFCRHSEQILANEWLYRIFLLHKETHRIRLQEKQGQLMPGTSLQVPAMMAASSGQQPPSPPQIYQTTMMMAQQKAQEQAQQDQAMKAPNPNAKKGAGPTAPKTPGPPGSGPRTAPGTPANNQAPAQQGG